MEPSLEHYRQVQSVGIHGLFYSEIEQKVLTRWIGSSVFPEMVPSLDNPDGIRNDFHRNIELAANPPFAQYYRPGEEDRPVIRAKAHLMASIATDPTSVLWGFADMFADRRDLSPVPHKLFDFGAQHGLQAFRSAAFYYAHPETPEEQRHSALVDAYRFLCGVAVEVLGPGYFPQWVSTSPTSGFVVLTSDFSPAPPPITFEDVFHQLTDLLIMSVTNRYDFGLGLRGLARHLNWVFANPAPNVFHLGPHGGPEYIEVRMDGPEGTVRRLPVA
ncbi:DUF6882 domain-containing protein [Corynebacterium sp. H130]|uniref:DUF6882 domain-containing protein n=1 Tax=Corynebacterium sp. H130 TaxID=3133444 RepID=UPI0030A11295